MLNNFLKFYFNDVNILKQMECFKENCSQDILHNKLKKSELLKEFTQVNSNFFQIPKGTEHFISESDMENFTLKCILQEKAIPEIKEQIYEDFMQKPISFKNSKTNCLDGLKQNLEIISMEVPVKKSNTSKMVYLVKLKTF